MEGSKKYLAEKIQMAAIVLCDWPDPTDWGNLSKEFARCHRNLLTATENFPVELSNSKVAGRNYSFIYFISGIIEHDYYHYGQIGSVLAGIKKIGEITF